jgi:DNA-binding NarL/FixJ family response regulator
LSARYSHGAKLPRTEETRLGILTLMAFGKTNAEIGEFYEVSSHTIEKYLCETLYPSLDLESPAWCSTRRAEAVGQAYRLGLLS